MTQKGLAIKVSGVSKQYFRNRSGKADFLKSLFKKQHHDSFNALQEISIDIHKGEVLGIIGPNGSGKSTLLKLISGITPPSEGCIDVWGKTASILEIGIGFQPDLSGYENIFLSGYMYGLTKAEINSKIKSITALFGFPEFLYTPVKHYSSGMYMRLAFSLIIHINTDIYLFDEILSVGDIYFQQAAMAEIKRLKQRGATILFVSHDPNNISGLTDRILFLNQSKTAFCGAPGEATIRYHEQLTGMRTYAEDLPELKEDTLSKIKRSLSSDSDLVCDLIHVRVFNDKNTKEINGNESIIVDCLLSYKGYTPNLFYLLVKDMNQTIITSAAVPLQALAELKKLMVRFTIPPKSLLKARYYFDFGMSVNENLAVIYPRACVIHIKTDKSELYGYTNLRINSQTEWYE